MHCEKTRLASIENGRLESLVCELLFYNFVYTGNLLELREGGEKRKRKKDHKVNEIEHKIIEGCSGTLNDATTFRIHFPHWYKKFQSAGLMGGRGVFAPLTTKIKSDTILHLRYHKSSFCECSFL